MLTIPEICDLELQGTCFSGTRSPRALAVVMFEVYLKDVTFKGLTTVTSNGSCSLIPFSVGKMVLQGKLQYLLCFF